MINNVCFGKEFFSEVVSVFPRWHVPQCRVRVLYIVIFQPFFGLSSYLVQVIEPIYIRYALTIMPVQPFHEYISRAFRLYEHDFQSLVFMEGFKKTFGRFRFYRKVCPHGLHIAETEIEFSTKQIQIIIVTW